MIRRKNRWRRYKSGRKRTWSESWRGGKPFSCSPWTLEGARDERLTPLQYTSERGDKIDSIRMEEDRGRELAETCFDGFLTQGLHGRQLGTAGGRRR